MVQVGPLVRVREAMALVLESAAAVPVLPMTTVAATSAVGAAAAQMVASARQVQPAVPQQEAPSPSARVDRADPWLTKKPY